jgi:hypothetical protein
MSKCSAVIWSSADAAVSEACQPCASCLAACAVHNTRHDMLVGALCQVCKTGQCPQTSVRLLLDSSPNNLPCMPCSLHEAQQPAVQMFSVSSTPTQPFMPWSLQQRRGHAQIDDACHISLALKSLICTCTVCTSANSIQHIPVLRCPSWFMQGFTDTAFLVF